MSLIHRPFVKHLAVIAFFLLLALIVTYPLVMNISTHFSGFPYGDAPEMAHHIWWMGYALRNGEPLYQQTLLGYPDGIDGSILWANPLQFIPPSVLALFLPLPAALNIYMLITMALNGWAMWLFSKYLITTVGGAYMPPVQRSEINFPALIAGVVFMLFPTMQGHLGAGHTGLMVQWGVPLYAYCLFRLSENAITLRRWGLIALTALCFLISAAGHSLQVIYVLMPLSGLFALALIVRRRWAALIRVIIAAALGTIALLIFLLPVIIPTLGTSSYTDTGGAIRYSADLLAAITPSFLHPIWGRLDYTRQVLGVNLDEGAAYFGIFACCLALLRRCVTKPRAGGFLSRWSLMCCRWACCSRCWISLWVFKSRVTHRISRCRSR